MASVTWTCNKDARIADNGSNLGAGASDFNPVGLYGSYLYRTLLGFPYSFAGMVTITSAILHLRTSTQSYVAFGSDPDFRVQRCASAWSEGSSVGLSGSNAVHWGNQPAGVGSTVFCTPSESESTWGTYDITLLINEAKSAGVFHGLRLYANNEGSTADTTEFYSREQGSSDPYIVVTYTTNVGPSAPSSCLPTGGGIVAGGLTPTISFTHVDSDGDALLDYDLQVSTDSTFASVTHWDVAAQVAGIAGNNVSRVYAGTALTRGITYYWRARTSAAAGILTEGAWSPAAAFRVNQLPTVAFVTPSAADALVEMVKVAGVATAPRMVIRWNFNDPDGGAQYSYRVVVVTDALAAFHDSGTLVDTASSLVIPVDPTRAAFYRVTVTVTDQNGESVSTAQVRMKAQWAVVEYRADTGAVPTAWSTSAASTSPVNTLVVTEYASSAAGGAIGTWYSALASAGLNRWFHWRVWLFAWSGAASPSLSKMALTYTSSAGVPPDGWAVDAQHALDTGTRVYGTQSLKATGNGVAHNAYQLVPVQKNTDYILSGRIKSDGNSGAQIVLSTFNTSGAVAASPAVVAGQEWGRVQTPVWNSGDNEEIWVRCYINGAGGTAAWFDALKLEASKVVTAWTPGFVGAGVSVDAGGIRVDASPKGGATFRLLGSTGGARDTVELAANGLRFGGDYDLWSPVAKRFDMTGWSVSRPTTAAGGGAGTPGYWSRVATGSVTAQFQGQHFLCAWGQTWGTSVINSNGLAYITIQQQAAFGNQPNVIIHSLPGGNGLASDIAVVVTSVAGPTTFEVWVRSSVSYAVPTFNVLQTYESAGLLTPVEGFALQAAVGSGTAYYGRSWHPGLATGAGAAFPANPATNDKFYRTDLRLEFFWDGTRWLSTTLYHALLNGDNMAATTGNNRTTNLIGKGMSDVWLERLQWAWYVAGGTALSASHKWVGVVQRNGSPGGTLTTLTIQSGTLSSWTIGPVVDLDVVMGGTGQANLETIWTKTGTPGNLYASYNLGYRQVAV